MTKTVLIVDDDRGLQETLEAILDFEGYTPIIAGDGFEAIQRIRETRPEIILLDLAMPRMDGAAFMEELRRQEAGRAIPVIVLTADGRAREKAARIGASGYLEKPFHIPKLIQQIEQLADLGPAQRNE